MSERVRFAARERRWTVATALLAGLVVLVGYAPRVAPGLLGGDSGEFQMAAWLAGLAHPTGYPLYLLLGWLWTHMLAPLGVEPAAAMNWLSALFGAAAVAGVVLAGEALQRRVAPQRPFVVRLAVAALLALVFGWSATFRSQALVAEVYTLNALFLALLLWLLLERAPLPWIGLVYGLSLTHHRTMLLWAPAVLAFLWLDRRDDLHRLRTLAWALVLVGLPQALYLYIPLRGPQTPYLHQPLAPGQTLTLYDGSLRAFWGQVSGSVFRGALGAGGSLPARLALVARLAGEQVGAPLLLPAAVLLAAGWLAWRRCWAVLVLLGLGALATIAFGVVYGIGDVEVMFIPAWLALALLVEPLVSALVARSRWLAGAALAAVPLLAVALLLASFRTPADATSPTDARTAWAALLAAGPPANAILVSNDRNEIVPLWYLQFVEGQRRDLLGLFPLVTRRPEHADVGAVVASALATGRPVRLIKSMPGLELRYDLAPGEGPLVAVAGPAEPPAHPPAEVDLAPAMAVTGWAAAPARLAAGSSLTVTLAWDVRDALPADLSTYVHLLDSAGTLVAQSDHQAGGVFYPSQLWPVGVRLRDRHRLGLPATLAPGVYQLRAGAYRNEPGGLVPLGREIALGRVTTASAAEPAAPPLETTPVGAVFGQPPLIALEGYAVHAPAGGTDWLAPGSPLMVVLVWRALAAPTTLYTTFVHLVPAAGEAPVSQADAPPRAGDYPSDVWQPGDVVTQTLVVDLPQTPGRYRLVVGLYQAERGERLPLSVGDSLTLTELRVGNDE
ncbi:MAG: DUF2723 domain-containing protein [Ardenticatenaceae bacterium]|nr:DUF2723 domain-containing protein [Ardenticatenaceae bacterium]